MAVTTVTCRRCEAAFDTDREPAREGADTRRCPGCGYKHGEGELDSRTVEPATDGGLSTQGSAVEITLSIRVTGVDDASELDVSIDD